MSDNEKIVELEKPGRSTFENYCNKNNHIVNYRFTTGKTGLDAVIQTDDFRNIGVEIKYRRFNYDKYPTLIFEKMKQDVFDRRYKKYSKLDIKSNIHYDDILYVNVFEDGSMIMYNYSNILDKINNGEYKTEISYMNYATFKDNTKSAKEVYYLKISDGIYVKTCA